MNICSPFKSCSIRKRVLRLFACSADLLREVCDRERMPGICGTMPVFCEKY